MAHTIYAGKVNKRRNSTLQPTLNTSFDVLLKTPTSLHTPTFTINASAFDFNYLKWDDRYYFVTDIVARNNNLWDVSAVIDVLATYKADILASTQYVSYSSEQGNAWLADTRIPVLKSTTVSRSTTTPSFLSNTGSYVLSVVGRNGCASYRLAGIAALITLISGLQSWTDDARRAIENFLVNVNPNSTEEAIIALGRGLNDTGFLGNRYENAVNAIRECRWLPYDGSWLSQSSSRIWLGEYDTGIDGYYLPSDNKTDTISVNIPWHFNDWRRGYCEDVYLYLPLVGMVQLSADSLTHASSISIKISVARIAGDIAYEVISGNEVIGTYGASPAAEIPIGVNQKSSLGSIAQTAFAGVQKTVSSGLHAAHPLAGAASKANAIFNGIDAAYQTLNVAASSNMSTIGGIGGSAGAGLDLSVICYTVAHNTIVEPADMCDTMGLPTMKPMSLSSLTGFCQCANAHVPAAAEAEELDAIDAYLNSGFYIE